MSKTKFLHKDLQKALLRLRDSLNYPVEEEDIYRDATIQRFEYTFELSWKLMQAVLKDSGVITISPAETIKNAAENELIEDVEKWLEFLKARNVTSHNYRIDLAEEVYDRAKELPEYVDKLLRILEESTN